jgi:hypothetical protein
MYADYGNNEKDKEGNDAVNAVIALHTNLNKY